MQTNVVDSPADVQDAPRQAAPAPLPPLAQKLVDLREEAGMTQETLAKRAGVSEAVISTAETGARPITARHMALVTLALGTNPVDAIELVWSAARKEPVVVERVDKSQRWIAELAPWTVDATEDEIELAAHMFKVSLGYQSGRLPRRGRKAKLHIGRLSRPPRPAMRP